MKNNLLPGQLTNGRYSFCKDGLGVQVYLPVHHLIYQFDTGTEWKHYSKELDSMVTTKVIKIKKHYFMMSQIFLNYKQCFIDPYAAYNLCLSRSKEIKEKVIKKYKTEIKDALFEETFQL